MNKFKVYVSWTVIESDCYEVLGEDKDDAEEIAVALAADDSGADDVEVERIVDLGEYVEPPYVDPNQLKFEEVINDVQR